MAELEHAVFYGLIAQFADRAVVGDEFAQVGGVAEEFEDAASAGVAAHAAVGAAAGSHEFFAFVAVEHVADFFEGVRGVGKVERQYALGADGADEALADDAQK